jgi:hypothetical protein
MVTVFAVLIMVAIAYSQIREGILTAATTLVNIVLAGLVTFMFFEPLAEELGKMMAGSAFDQMEDAIAMFTVFAGVLGLLRLVTNNLANQDLEMPALPQQIGTVIIGLVAGYFLSGFLVVMVSTLPVQENFLGYEAAVQDGEPALRRYLPPDRVWLALMQHAGKPPGLGFGGQTFDPEGTFPLRYAKKRRIKEAPAAPGG